MIEGRKEMVTKKKNLYFSVFIFSAEYYNVENLSLKSLTTKLKFMWTPQIAEMFNLCREYKYNFFVALLKIITSIPGNSYHLEIYNMTWMRVEIHWNFTFLSKCEWASKPIDYNVVFYLSRETTLRDKVLNSYHDIVLP